MTNSPNTLALLKLQYKRYQQWAEQNKCPELLAKAVVWTVNDRTAKDNFHPELTDEQEWEAARWGVALTTMKWEQEGLTPDVIWRSLVA